MHIVVGVDWSNQAFTAVQVATRLYTPEELTLVHALDLGFLAHPTVAQAMELRGHDEFLRAMPFAVVPLLMYGSLSIGLRNERARLFNKEH